MHCSKHPWAKRVSAPSKRPPPLWGQNCASAHPHFGSKLCKRPCVFTWHFSVQTCAHSYNMSRNLSKHTLLRSRQNREFGAQSFWYARPRFCASICQGLLVRKFSSCQRNLFACASVHHLVHISSQCVRT